MSLIKLSVYGILRDQGKVLMQKRSNTSFANGWWSFPGGHVEAGESISVAVSRELKEEMGILVNPDQCEFSLTLIRKPQIDKRYINFFYTIDDWQGIPTICDGKASELNFFSLNEIPELTLPYIREAMHLVDRGIKFHESEC